MNGKKVTTTPPMDITDLISRDAAIAAAHNVIRNHLGDVRSGIPSRIAEAIRALPAVQANDSDSRLGEYVMQTARSLGWPEGNIGPLSKHTGPLEYILKCSAEQTSLSAKLCEEATRDYSQLEANMLRAAAGIIDGEYK